MLNNLNILTTPLCDLIQMTVKADFRYMNAN